MVYTSANITVANSLKLLETRGVSHPQGQMLQALRDGRLPSWGLVAMLPIASARGRSMPSAGAWRQLSPSWWHHLNSPLDNAVYFDHRPTKPPTPFRAERIEVPRKIIDKLWPEPLGVSVGAEELASADDGAAKARPRRLSRSKPERERARRAIDELYNDGNIPDEASVPNKALLSIVNDYLAKMTPPLPPVKMDSCLRAVGRRK
jgi:hypothetical protein